MKQSVLRFAAQLWAMLAVLLLFVAAALPAHADDGDMDEITHYTVTVDTRADGSADITYELDWNVIGGSLDEPLTWVRIGLPNSHNDSLVNLTPDTVLNVSSVDDGGSFARLILSTPTSRRILPPPSAHRAAYTLRFRYTSPICFC